MSIIREHVDYYREIFSSKHFRREPFLMIGLPVIEGHYMPDDFAYHNLKELVRSKGVKEISSLDLFDPKADIKHDLNKPVPKKYHNKFMVVADFGTIEHIFDTKQCLDNYFRMIKNKGLLVILTVVNGYYEHGLHVFNPEGLIKVFELNGFKIVYKKFTSSTGIEVEDPSINKNILIWLAARKIGTVRHFKVPQQQVWKSIYKRQKRNMEEEKTIVDGFAFYFREIKRRFINRMPMTLKNLLYGRY